MGLRINNFSARLIAVSMLLLAAASAWATIIVQSSNIARPAVSGGGGGGEFTTTVFNCGTGGTAFTYVTGTPTTDCAVAQDDYPSNGFGIRAYAAVESGVVYMTPAGDGGHVAQAFMRSQKVNVQAFRATFRFIPDGMNLALVIQNSDNNPGYDGRDLAGGAGCEAGFFQAFGTTPNLIWALAFSQIGPLLNEIDHPEGAGTFNYSGVQVYTEGQAPCSYVATPAWDPTPPFSIPDKYSTSPVALNSPATTGNTTTGDVYEATVTYDGTDVDLSLYNVTDGDSCPGANCYTRTFSGINIPSLVGANTAWLALTGGCNSNCVTRMNVHSFKYETP